MKVFFLAIIFALSIFAPSSTLAIQYSADEEKCIADNGLIRLQVPILGCDASARDAKEICCSAGDSQTIATKDAPTYIAGIFSSGISFIAIIAVGALVLGGVMYLTSRGNPDYVSQAKTFMKNAVMALVLLIFSYTILNQIDPRLTKLDVTDVATIKAIKCCQISDKKEYYFQSKQDEAKKKYICNVDQDKVVADSFCASLQLAEGDVQEEIICDLGTIAPDNNNIDRAQLLTMLKTSTNIGYALKASADGLDALKDDTLRVIERLTRLLPKLTITSLAEDTPSHPSGSLHSDGRGIDLRTKDGALSEDQITQIKNLIGGLNTVTQVIHCLPGSGSIVCDTPFGASNRCDPTFTKAWCYPFSEAQIKTLCNHRDHVHITIKK